MKLPSLTLLLAMTCAASFSPAWAAPFEISDGWFRSLPGKLPAAGYFSAQNNTGREIAITGARSDGCGMLMLHQSDRKSGMSSMDTVNQVKVPPGGLVAFAPGGYHLMCSDPKMKIGTRVAVLLDLSDGSAVAVAFTVRGATGK